jgi:hypothetical protein
MIKGALHAASAVIRQWWERPLLGRAFGPAMESCATRAPSLAVGSRAAVAVALFLAALAAGSSYVRSSMLTPVIHQYYGYGVDAKSGPRTTNLLFDADIPKITFIMTERRSPKHAHTHEHPLMSLAMYPPVQILRMAGLSDIQAIRFSMTALCGVWTILMFSLLALSGCRLLDAAAFTVLAQVSAASMFWFSVPEVFAFGSATIVGALILSLWPTGTNPLVRYGAAMALSTTMTVTNAMVGLIAAAQRLSPKDLWIAGTSAWFVVTMLWVLQSRVFPAAEFFLPPRSGFVSTYLFTPSPARIAEVVQAFVSHTVVMPEMKVIAGADLHLQGSTDRMLSVQRSLAGTGLVIGTVATLAWLVLVGLAFWALCTVRSGLSVLCSLVGVGQIALHLLFGSETFLYAMHMLPLLIVLTASVTLTRWRPVCLGLVAVVIVFGGVNNWMQFQKAAAVVHEVDAYARTFPGARLP